MHENVTAADIVREFAFLTHEYDFSVESLTDDVLVSYAVFVRRPVRVSVEFDKRSYQPDVIFERCDENGEPEYRATLYLILTLNNAVDKPSFSTGQQQPSIIRIRRSAQLCRQFAGPALRGDVDYYGKLRDVNRRIMQRPID